MTESKESFIERTGTWIKKNPFKFFLIILLTGAVLGIIILALNEYVFKDDDESSEGLTCNECLDKFCINPQTGESYLKITEREDYDPTNNVNDCKAAIHLKMCQCQKQFYPGGTGVCTNNCINENYPREEACFIDPQIIEDGTTELEVCDLLSDPKIKTRTPTGEELKKVFSRMNK